MPTFTIINAGLPVILYDGSSYLYGSGLEAMEQSGDWYCFLADGLGSTMAIVDDAGAVQNSYTYDVYGEPTVTGSLANEFDFAGQQTDGDTGLQYLRARYMDPETGVFFSRDPLAAMPSWLGGHFGYASGNPATATDPTGLCDDTRTDGCEGGDIYIRTVDPYGDPLIPGHFVDQVVDGGYRECFSSHYSNSLVCEWKPFDSGSDGSNLFGDMLDTTQCGGFQLQREYCTAHRAIKWCAQDSACRDLVDGFLRGVSNLNDTAEEIIALAGVAGLAAATIRSVSSLLGRAALPLAVGIAGWNLYKAAYEPPRAARKRVY